MHAHIPTCIYARVYSCARARVRFDFPRLGLRSCFIYACVCIGCCHMSLWRGMPIARDTYTKHVKRMEARLQNHAVHTTSYLLYPEAWRSARNLWERYVHVITTVTLHKQ